MAKKLQIKRGARASMPTLAQGEFGMTTDSGSEGLFIGTGTENIEFARKSDLDAIPTPDVSGQIGTHNSDSSAHSDIRLLIQGLTTRLNTLADSDDATLDQLSEVVAYIKSNKSLIDAITTSKVNVADIVDNLTTNVANKPLSAAQGVALKALINAITVPAIDDTLTKSGAAADAAVVGERLSSLSEEMVTEETDPTVPAWAKEPTKPSYTASEVGADPSGTADAKVAAHNTGTDTHSDIRLLIQGLTDRLNALADSDDTTLDQLSEIVAYIKSNRDLISSITTSKVSVADIIDNLTTNVSNKPLSAAQGVALKALIDAIIIPDKLPNPNVLTFTGAVTGSYDGSEPVTVEIPSGGGTEGKAWTYLGEFDLSVANTVEFTELQNVTEIYVRWADVKNEKTTESSYVLKVNDVIVINGIIPVKTTNTVYGWSWAKYNGLYWTGSATVGYKSDRNTALNAASSQVPHYVNTEVGKAQSIKLSPTSATWAATAGILNVYVR